MAAVEDGLRELTGTQIVCLKPAGRSMSGRPSLLPSTAAADDAPTWGNLRSGLSGVPVNVSRRGDDGRSPV
jgi:hypothetical protein